MKIRKIRSGGQSGIDRAALDTAKEKGIEICGWCPKGGWAEDYTDPPGILALYPELKETPRSCVEQRTVWNVRDSDATLIIHPKKTKISKGTDLTEIAAKTFRKPYLIFTGDQGIEEIINWLETLDEELTLNIAGPRASECPKIYDVTVERLRRVFNAGNI